MKNIIFLLLSFVIISCSSDSSDTASSSPIVGKWFEHKKINYFADGTVHSEFLNSTEPCYSMTTYEYKANGQFIKDSYDYVNTNCVQNTLRTGTWSVSDNNLSIEVNNSLENSNIDLISEERLLLKKNNTGDAYEYSIVEYIKVN